MIKFASSLGFVLFTNAIESILLSSLVSFRRVLSLSLWPQIANNIRELD